MPLDEEIKGLIEAQGKAFEAFKETHASELKRADTVTAEKLAKIEKALDAAVEAKAKIDVAIESERKEREALELRLSKIGSRGGDEKKAAAVQDFQHLLKSINAERGRAVPTVDEAAYDEYKAGFSRFMREGKESLDATEIKTMSVGSDPDGGYFVTPDVSGRIVMRVYESSPMRQVANVQTISTDRLEGIEDLGEAGAGYAGENSQGTDTTTPQVGKWSIPVYWIDTEPKTTQQLLDDAMVDIEGWLSGKVSDKIARFENAEFVTGATKIRGITSYTTAADSGSGVTWGTFGHVVTGVNGDFAASVKGDILYDAVGLVKAEYLTAARWMTRRSVITAIRKFKDGQGNYLWQPSLVAGTPETILGYPVTRAEDMPALGTGSLSLAFGDFGAAYQIVDRQGIRVMRDAYTSKPFVKFYTTKRTGGGAVNFEAVKFVKFST
jgi:HK97 family phage major capsid protein